MRTLSKFSSLTATLLKAQLQIIVFSILCTMQGLKACFCPGGGGIKPDILTDPPIPVLPSGGGVFRSWLIVSIYCNIFPLSPGEVVIYPIKTSRPMCCTTTFRWILVFISLCPHVGCKSFNVFSNKFWNIYIPCNLFSQCPVTYGICKKIIYKLTCLAWC